MQTDQEKPTHAGFRTAKQVPTMIIQDNRATLSRQSAATSANSAFKRFRSQKSLSEQSNPERKPQLHIGITSGANHHSNTEPVSNLTLSGTSDELRTEASST